MKSRDSIVAPLPDWSWPWCHMRSIWLAIDWRMSLMCSSLGESGNGLILSSGGRRGWGTGYGKGEPGDRMEG